MRAEVLLTQWAAIRSPSLLVLPTSPSMPLRKGEFALKVSSIKFMSVTFTSYKFHRLFPLSQYDLPSHNSKILSFSRPVRSARSASVSRPSNTTTEHQSSSTPPTKITQEQISENNPHVDYTRYDYSNACRQNALPVIPRI